MARRVGAVPPTRRKAAAWRDLRPLTVRRHSSIKEAMVCIDRSDCKIALVLDANRRLLDTVTDGDIRRAILAGLDVNAPLSALTPQKATSPYPKPVTAKAGATPAILLGVMEEFSVRHLPLLDDQERVVDLVTRRDLVPDEGFAVQAVVMAGGYGQRLRPLTDDLPKAMLPVGKRPLLELILEELRQAGVHQVNLTTHYKGEMIAKHFGDGGRFGVSIRYIKEDAPLGTAGSLSQLDGDDDEPVLVMNGDILTKVDFRAMLDFHREHRADMTVAVREYPVNVPYGVIEIETDGVTVTGLSEKPLLRHFINAGIYLLNRQVCRMVPTGVSYDMTDLISRLVRERSRVVGFPVREYWMDIGHMENYRKALDDVTQQGRVSS